jgi:hypothetical protein
VDNGNSIVQYSDRLLPFFPPQPRLSFQSQVLLLAAGILLSAHLFESAGQGCGGSRERLQFWIGIGLYEPMSRAANLFLAMLLGFLSRSSASPSPAEGAEDALRIYAVNVVKTPPLETPFVGYGIYLGQGLVITAAHVVGHWPSLTHPTVRIAGQDFATKILKEGSFQKTDLALLAVDEGKLPATLRLRRNPLCTAAPRVGMDIIHVLPQQVSRAHVISPLSIAPELRHRFATLIDTPLESGSGLFDPEQRCLLGIVSAKIMKFSYQSTVAGVTAKPNGFAGYFVPASQILRFIPQNLHF